MDGQLAERRHLAVVAHADQPGIAAIVLAGGRSHRMGTDKAVLRVNGQRMVDRAVNAVHAAGCNPVVISGRADAIRDDVIAVADELRDQGPLAGIVGGWNQLTGDPGTHAAVVLSCDLPNVDGPTVAKLCGAWRDAQRLGADDFSGTDAVVAHDGISPQPLVAVYGAAALRRCVAAFDGGERSMRHMLATLHVREMTMDSAPIADADNPGDLDGFDVEWPTVPDR